MKHLIYIRHGNDRRGDHKYDQVLSQKGKENAKEKAKELIEKYGIPDAIYCSPYYRTRQTRSQMLKVISTHTDRKIKKAIDYRLSRFFTKRQSKNPDIRRDTKRKAPIYETWRDFTSRVKKQLNHMESKKEKYNVIWCIGHTLILTNIIKLKNLERSKHIEYLDTIVL